MEALEDLDGDLVVRLDCLRLPEEDFRGGGLETRVFSGAGFGLGGGGFVEVCVLKLGVE